MTQKFALLVCVAGMLPSNLAFACGMYVERPIAHERLLADVFQEIDTNATQLDVTAGLEDALGKAKLNFALAIDTLEDAAHAVADADSSPSVGDDLHER